MIDEEFKNKAITRQVMSRYRIKIKLNLTYHSMSNERIEKEYRLIINVLSRLIKTKIEL